MSSSAPPSENGTHASCDDLHVDALAKNGPLSCRGPGRSIDAAASHVDVSALDAVGAVVICVPPHQLRPQEVPLGSPPLPVVPRLEAEDAALVLPDLLAAGFEEGEDRHESQHFVREHDAPHMRIGGRPAVPGLGQVQVRDAEGLTGFCGPSR
jgi:hypothetical protein